MWCQINGTFFLSTCRKYISYMYQVVRFIALATLSYSDMAFFVLTPLLRWNNLFCSFCEQKMLRHRGQNKIKAC